MSIGQAASFVEEIRSREKWSPDGWETWTELVAVIVRREYDRPGVSFLTAPGEPQQLALIHHPEGYVVPAHTHKPVRRDIHQTQETLIVRSGRVRLDLYDTDGEPLGSRTLSAGDVVILLRGGHGLTCETEAEFWEVKVGPYLGRDRDKANLPVL